MQGYSLPAFGLDQLTLTNIATPQPGPGDVVVDVKAVSLNYRDLMVVKGLYNPKLRLPAVPLSDGAGVIAAVGDGVTRVRPGDRICSHFVADWIDGPFDLRYVQTTLGTPGAGLAAEQVVLPAEAVVPLPPDYDFPAGATLPIAALTAWGCLQTVTDVRPGDTVLTLGTGGVALFTLQLATALGAQVIITSSSDEKLERCRALGAAHTINYQNTPAWHERVLELTDGRGVDVTVETAGPGTLDQSMRCTKAGGHIALPGALTGRSGEISTGLMMMRRLTLAGVLVDSRVVFEKMNAFIAEKGLQPVISNTFSFDQLSEAFALMERGGHFGKIVLTL